MEKTHNIQKLTNTSLDCISGGKLPLAVDQVLCDFGLVITSAGILGSAACSIASAVYSSKAHKAIQNGDTKNAEKYAKTAKSLTLTTAALSSAVPVGITSTVIGVIDGLQDPTVKQQLKSTALAITR